MMNLGEILWVVAEVNDKIPIAEERQVPEYVCGKVGSTRVHLVSRADDDGWNEGARR